jgi:hypothetical protein
MSVEDFETICKKFVDYFSKYGKTDELLWLHLVQQRIAQ